MRKTLARLLAEPLDHVIVVENGSSDGTREWLASLEDGRLTVIEMAQNGGGALGFEVGMREASVRFNPDWLGPRLIEFQSQNRTVAASAMAEKKVSGQRSYRVATRLQSFRRPNMISMRLRRL